MGYLQLSMLLIFSSNVCILLTKLFLKRTHPHLGHLDIRIYNSFSVCNFDKLKPANGFHDGLSIQLQMMVKNI